MTHFIIETMTQAEVKLAIEWAAQEGWNPGLNDATCFYASDPKGFFAGKINDEIIVVGSAVIYDPHFAFCGLYVTKPQYRGCGYGMQLTQARLKYVGNRITGIDGVLENIAKYEKIGYVSAYRNIRFRYDQQSVYIPHESITNLSQVTFDDLIDFDGQYFPARREAFLSCWIRQSNATALAFTRKQQLLGYGVIRKCRLGYKIGPLFAIDSQVAEQLFLALIAKKAPPFFIDIPEPNLDALQLIKKYNLQEVFATIRMYRNGMPNIEVNGVYGVTSFELG